MTPPPSTALDSVSVALAARKRILLGQLVSNGDCLFATAVARQIKADFPGCFLTWAIGSPCRHLLEGNPHVDAVWEVPIANSQSPEVIAAWRRFRDEACVRQARGEFDEMFFTQIAPDNLHNYDGMIRSSIFRGYPLPITVPITPVVRLSAPEIENVRAFATRHGLDGPRARVVLFEFAPQSGQSFITPEFALQMAREIVTQVNDTYVVLSSHRAIETGHPRIIDGSTISFRENAELTKYCILLVGCSSGISWLATSEAAKPLPMIQILKGGSYWFNSLLRDFQHWGLATDLLIEIEDRHGEHLLPCIMTVFSEGFASARKTFHETIPRRFESYGALQRILIRQGRLREAWRLMILNVCQYGFRPQLFVCHLSWAATKLTLALRTTLPKGRRA